MSRFECARRRKLPARYASIVMPFILSIMMTFIVSLIATAKSLGFTHPELASSWMGAWLFHGWSRFRCSSPFCPSCAEWSPCCASHISFKNKSRAA